MSLIVTDSTFVDLEPHDPEAECLRRLFGTGLFDIPITEETFSFNGTTLRLIARLDEYSFEPSTVMARIACINPDNIVYLGCTVCRMLVHPTHIGLVSCQQCHNSKARYFYTLTAELADFSDVVTVSLTDDASRKLIGQPAGAMLKLTNEQLQSKLAKLLFRPMLFRLFLQDSKWRVEDWKYLDIPRFKPYLKSIAEQKGYK